MVPQGMAIAFICIQLAIGHCKYSEWFLIMMIIILGIVVTNMETMIRLKYGRNIKWKFTSLELPIILIKLISLIIQIIQIILIILIILTQGGIQI
jgi:hypothetical protein